jgi:hypothetical protein
MIGTAQIWNHSNGSCRVRLTHDINTNIIEFRELTVWLTNNTDYNWAIANKDSLEFSNRDDAMMFYLRFK